MIYLAVILIIIVCVLLIIAILIQNPKGGGLGAGFGGMGNQVMGARRANDFIEKTTWSLVGAMLALCLLSGMAIKKGGTASTAAQDTELQTKMKENATSVPSAPANSQQRPGGAVQGPQGPPQQPQGQPRPTGQPQPGQPTGQPQQPASAQPQGGQPK